MGEPCIEPMRANADVASHARGRAWQAAIDIAGIEIRWRLNLLPNFTPRIACRLLAPIERRAAAGLHHAPNYDSTRASPTTATVCRHVTCPVQTFVRPFPSCIELLPGPATTSSDHCIPCRGKSAGAIATGTAELAI
jgi:hypothetical protein